MRLAVCLSHPIQYKSPLLRLLSSQPGLQLQVFYYSNRGLVSKKNTYHGGIPAWDIPLLDGYTSDFLPNLVDEEKWKNSIFQPFINPSIFKRLIVDGYDAVIIHSYQYPSDWFAFIAAKIRHIPVLFYGEMYPRKNLSLLRQIGRLFLHRIMVRGADACLAIGSLAHRVYRDEYHIPEERIFLAPYTVDNKSIIDKVNTYKLQRNLLKAELGLPENIPVVLCVAAMVPKKHQQDLVEAISRIRMPVCLVLVGHGPLFQEVHEFCRQILPDTILTGFINQSELPRYYAAADIFVLPSLWEEFGLVINEAMCAGLPIVASNTVAATHDLVYEGQNGFTFSPGDVEALANYIELLLRDQALREKFGQRSQGIISHWSPGQTLCGILTALDYISRKD